MVERRANSSKAGAAGIHVLHVADADTFDRFGRMLRHLSLAQTTEGLRVSVLTDAPQAPATFEGTPIECVPVRGLRGWYGWQAARRCARAAPATVALAHFWGTSALRLIGRWVVRRGLPLFVHLLAATDVTRLRHWRWRAHARVLPGCAGLRDLAVHEGLVVEPPGACRPGLLMPEPPPAGPPEEQRTLGVLWTGRVTADAGLDTLVEAVAGLRQRGGDLQVVLLGDGPAVRPLRARIRALGVHDCVSLIEEAHLWPRALSGADVCVVPAPQAELALAPLMAMALEKIVIAARGQLAEWFIEDETAWQFAPGKAVELAYHLARVVESRRHADRLRASAAAYVRRHHAIGGLVSCLLAAYGRALERDPQAAAVASSTAEETAP